ncbi:MAG: dolichyl-phosphate beta-glucosyltransferase [Bacteroidia bacterium]
MSLNTNISISVVIPAYNESANIERSLSAILYYLNNKKFDFEVIVVNDGSKDNTLELAQKFLPQIKIIENPGNKGKGYSVKNGMLNATKENVMFLDADLATPIEELENALKYIDEYQVVIGSRNLKDSIILTAQPYYRQLMGKTFAFLARLVAGIKVKDSQCGFKMMKREVAQKIFPKMTITGWCFDVELLFLAQLENYKIKEMPVRWIDNAATTKIKPFTSSMEMFRDLLKVRNNYKKGLYK